MALGEFLSCSFIVLVDTLVDSITRCVTSHTYVATAKTNPRHKNGSKGAVPQTADSDRNT